MPVPADGAVRGGNAEAADAEVGSSCSSTTRGPCRSDPASASGDKRVVYPRRRPGFQRLDQLGFLEMSEVRDVRRAAQRALAATALTTADASRTTERLEPGAGPQVASVTALRVYWNVNPRFNGVLAAAIFCAVALFVYSESAVWIRIRYRHLFHAASRAAYTDHACLPFSFECDSTTCKMYTGATEYPLNRSQDPCNNFYRFVRDDWKHEHHLLSVLDAAEDMMYGRALNAIERAPRDILKPIPVQSVASSVIRSVIESARACIESSESSLQRLKMFMAEHHLPWPLTARTRWITLQGFTLSPSLSIQKVNREQGSERAMQNADPFPLMDLPEQLIEYVLSFVDETDLLGSCRHTCKLFRDIIDSNGFWKIKCLRYGKVIPAFKLEELPPRYYQRIYIGNPYDRNLLRNGYGDSPR
ncbi:hypothetical protein V5799_004020, partial [Amblyomma americanum]